MLGSATRTPTASDTSLETWRHQSQDPKDVGLSYLGVDKTFVLMNRKAN